MARRRVRWVWLAVAAILLGLGAWLMLGAEPPPRPPPPEVRMPTRMSREERERSQARQTWLPPVVLDAGAPLTPPPRPRDPLMTLMPTEVRRGAVVAAVNAIFNSDVGQLLYDCLFEGAPTLLSDLRDAGISPTTGIDRMALIDDALVLTGGDLRADAVKRLIPSGVARGYGQRGELIDWETPRGHQTIGLWGQQIMVVGRDEAQTKELLDRLESSGPAPTGGALQESDAWGEVYGVVTPDAVADLLGREEPQLGDVVRQTGKSFRLHLDASHDVGLVGNVEANDPQKADELRRALGSALALARMQAQARGRDDEAEVLDLARVRKGEGDAFTLEAGLPYETVKKALQQCVVVQRERRERRLREADAGGPADPEP